MLSCSYYSDSELTLLFMMTRTLNLTFVEKAGIRVEPLVHVKNIKNDNSQINRGNTIWINEVFLICHNSYLIMHTDKENTPHI